MLGSSVATASTAPRCIREAPALAALTRACLRTSSTSTLPAWRWRSRGRWLQQEHFQQLSALQVRCRRDAAPPGTRPAWQAGGGARALENKQAIGDLDPNLPSQQTNVTSNAGQAGSQRRSSKRPSGANPRWRCGRPGAQGAQSRRTRARPSVCRVGRILHRRGLSWQPRWENLIYRHPASRLRGRAANWNQCHA